MQLDTFEILKGSANIALRISCLLEQLKKQDVSQSKAGQLSGSMQLKSAQFQFKNDVLGYENIDADLYADDNYILVNNLVFCMVNRNLELRGELSNYQALIGNNSEKSLLRAYLVADNFELEDWLPKSQVKSVANKENNETYLKNIDLKLSTNITRFKFDQFIATNVKSNIYFRENQFQHSISSFFYHSFKF